MMRWHCNDVIGNLHVTIWYAASRVTQKILAVVWGYYVVLRRSFRPIFTFYICCFTIEGIGLCQQYCCWMEWWPIGRLQFAISKHLPGNSSISKRQPPNWQFYDNLRCKSKWTRPKTLKQLEHLMMQWNHYRSHSLICRALVYLKLSFLPITPSDLKQVRRGRVPGRSDPKRPSVESE